MVWWDQDKLIWFRWCQACMVATRWGVQRQVVSCLQSSMVVGVSWSGAAWVLPALGSYSSLREPWMPTCTVTYWSRLGRRAVFQQDNDPNTPPNDHCLAKEAEGKGDGLAKHVSRPKPYWASVGRSARSLTSTISVMSSWRSGRELQWQPVKLWWTTCPRGLRQCWKILVPPKILTLWAQFGHFT